MPAKFSIKKFLKSFTYAFNGLRAVWRTEQNMRVHAVAATIALTLCFLLNVSTVEFIIVIICIGVVIAFELLNTAIEKLCNIISPQKNDRIKDIKDISAGAVLVVSIIALICGLIIFIPKIINTIS